MTESGEGFQGLLLTPSFAEDCLEDTSHRVLAEDENANSHRNFLDAVVWGGGPDVTNCNHPCAQ